MAILWLKFPDEVVQYHNFTHESKKKLEEIFSTKPASSWSNALETIGLKKSPADTTLISWHESVPYFNWSCMVQTISGCAMSAIASADSYGFKFSPHHLWPLVISQWKIARFITRIGEIENKFVESIALGIALQALIMRLGSEAAHIGAWLSSPEQAPNKYRKIINQIQSIQLRRTHISHIWKDLFPPAAEESSSETTLPDFFWDDAIPVIKKEAQTKPAAKSQDKWKGSSVCSGERIGMAIAVRANQNIDKLLELKQKHSAPLILVFKRARPETTELFQYADAVLYTEGGILSHACTITREMNIPCITALGADFFSFVAEHEAIWLKINGGSGIIELV